MPTVITKWTCALLVLLSQFALAGLDFKQTVIEMNAALDATEVEARFDFTNSGKEPLSISHVDPDCSCIGVQIKGGKLDYQPGEAGVIRTKFHIGNQTGTVEQSVAVWMKGDPKDKPSIQLKVRIHIPRIVTLEPKSLKWQLGEDMTPKKLTVTIDYDQPVHITNVTSSKTEFTTEVVTIEKGKKYEIIVSPEAMKHPGMSIIRVETDAPVDNQRRQQAFVMVLKGGNTK